MSTIDIQKTCFAIISACATKHTVKHKRWVKSWLKKRDKYCHVVLLKEIIKTDPKDYKNYFCVSDSSYNKLLSMLKPLLERQNTNMRNCVSADERLAVTLRYLVIGRYFEDLKFFAIISPAIIISQVVLNLASTYIQSIQISFTIYIFFLFESLSVLHKVR